MNLATRKRLLITQADLHRQLIRLEGSQIRGRWDAWRESGGRNRWWLAGTAMAGGFLTRRLGGVVRWLPTLLSMWRSLKG
jgi:hypothetical protein